MSLFVYIGDTPRLVTLQTLSAGCPSGDHFSRMTLLRPPLRLLLSDLRSRTDRLECGAGELCSDGPLPTDADESPAERVGELFLPSTDTVSFMTVPSGMVIDRHLDVEACVGTRRLTWAFPSHERPPTPATYS